MSVSNSCQFWFLSNKQILAHGCRKLFQCAVEKHQTPLEYHAVVLANNPHESHFIDYNNIIY